MLGQADYGGVNVGILHAHGLNITCDRHPVL